MSILASAIGRAARSNVLHQISRSLVAVRNAVPQVDTPVFGAVPVALPPTVSAHDDARPTIHFSSRLYSTAQQEEEVPDSLPYQIEIVTGDIRGAGTSTPAVIILCGSRGKTAPLLIGNEEEASGFERGTSKYYTITLHEDIGDLQRVSVEQLTTSLTEVGTGWFLDKVNITAPDGELISFPCGQWFGKSDASSLIAPQHRNLIPCCFVSRKLDTHAEQVGDPLSVHAGGVTIPHPEKVQQGMKAINKRGEGFGGEDAYFYCKGRHNVYGLGVADGIYMWKLQGIDSGEFSRQLMRDASELIQEGVDDVLAVLQECERRIHAMGIKGSSTVCVVVIDMNQGRLSSANVGDSGFAVLGTTPSQHLLHVKYRSSQQEHEFGQPFQLGHNEGADSANDAMLMTLPVVPGDYVVLGSDGLFDNVSDEEMVDEVGRCMVAGHATPAAVARQLLALAYANSLERQKETPYSLAATEVFDMVYSGGKKDDITVLVAQLSEAK